MANELAKLRRLWRQSHPGGTVDVEQANSDGIALRLYGASGKGKGAFSAEDAGFGTARSPGIWAVRWAHLTRDNRGRGLGSQAYRVMAQHAWRQGAGLVPDAEAGGVTSQKARQVWDRLGFAFQGPVAVGPKLRRPRGKTLRFARSSVLKR